MSMASDSPSEEEEQFIQGSSGTALQKVPLVPRRPLTRLATSKTEFITIAEPADFPKNPSRRTRKVVVREELRLQAVEQGKVLSEVVIPQEVKEVARRSLKPRKGKRERTRLRKECERLQADAEAHTKQQQEVLERVQKGQFD
eukprot:g2598.t1